LLSRQGAELVILSVCDSGSGEVKIGEAVMSLRRAFRIAGAETVLASHWKVNDKATSRLMTEFIRRWRSGEQFVYAGCYGLAYQSLPYPSVKFMVFRSFQEFSGINFHYS